jgi:four helix bundle protein
MTDFMKLEVWKRAHVLALEIYKCAKKLPDSDQEYGIAFDVCQTALQVPAGIARSCAFEEFDEVEEFRDCMEETRMALRQVDMQLMVMRDLGHLSRPECERLLKMGEEVRELLIQRQNRKKKTTKS